jgi:predicted molibdopterin-dependent oxidoreductase YjgC
MTYELILEKGAVRWPCNAEHPQGTERLYEDFRFWTAIDDCESYGTDFLTGNKATRTDYESIDPKGKAFLRPVQWRRQPNPPTEDYPFVLSTGRVVYHFHTRTKTARSEALNRRVPDAYVEIHPEDANRLGISLGDWVEVSSSRGHWEGPAMVVDTVRPGELFIPFHFGKGRQAANQHTTYARDPVSKQPQFKSSPVQLRRLSFAAPERWLMERQLDLMGTDARPYASREIR